VCQHWKTISQISWKTFKIINLSHVLWGVDSKSKVRVDHYVLRKVLIKCGRYLTHVDLSYEQEHYIKPDNIISITSCRSLITMVHRLCPNIKYINLGRPYDTSTLAFVMKNFSNLRSFGIQNITKEYEPNLVKLFHNNRNLEQIIFDNCHFSGSCLSFVNTETVQAFQLKDTFISSIDNLVKVGT
jgi:hypothetical protein